MSCNLILALAVTSHLGLVGDYNAAHPSIRCEFDSGMVVGAFYNSERKGSAFAAYKWADERAFLELGLVTGYSDASVMPFVRAGLQLTDQLSIFAAPAYEVWDGKERVGLVIGTEITF